MRRLAGHRPRRGQRRLAPAGQGHPGRGRRTGSHRPSAPGPRPRAHFPGPRPRNRGSPPPTPAPRRRAAPAPGGLSAPRAAAVCRRTGSRRRSGSRGARRCGWRIGSTLLQRGACQTDAALQCPIPHHHVRPEDIQQLLFAHDPVAVPDEVQEQIQDEWLQGHLAAVRAQLTLLLVDFDGGESVDHRIGRSGAARNKSGFGKVARSDGQATPPYNITQAMPDRVRWAGLRGPLERGWEAGPHPGLRPPLSIKSGWRGA